MKDNTDENFHCLSLEWVAAGVKSKVSSKWKKLARRHIWHDMAVRMCDLTAIQIQDEMLCHVKEM